ncbi:hypothetical protein MASR2M78_15770 [Treponema sp.]
MDASVVKAKLESLSRCIKRIEGRIPVSAAVLAQDFDAQDIITLNLERTVQLAVDAGAHLLLDFECPSPDTMGGVFRSLGNNGIIDDAIS